MRRKLLWPIVVVAVMMASVCWTRWSMRSRDRANSRTLADGSVVWLKEAAFGRPLRVRTGDRWQDYVGMAIPEPWAKKLGAGFLSVGDSNRFAVLLKLTRKVYYSGRGPWTSSDLRATTFDQHGCEF